ncbi:MAG: acyl-CoA thioesterase [Desulfovibrionaceae bacterium]|jgi:acyl-CoA hydrolase|nr:acyl-CoA thioesterase [Desulfovibrionaceae bacterium]
MTKPADTQAGKPVSASETIMAHRMMPQDANPAGTIHGGVILRYIDQSAATAALRHARGNTVVTASIDRMDFLMPVYVGELLTLKSAVNLVGSTSMEIGVRAEAENLFTGEVRHVASAYLTFVAIAKDRKPTRVPPLLLETDEQRRRSREAADRKERRREERTSERRSAAEG